MTTGFTEMASVDGVIRPTAEATIGLALTAIVIVVVAPFSEELFFRGALTGAFAQRLGAFTPLASGAIFGAAHLEPRAFPALFVLGVLLGWLYMNTRSLVPGMAVHVTMRVGVIVQGIVMVVIVRHSAVIARENSNTITGEGEIVGWAKRSVPTIQNSDSR